MTNRKPVGTVKFKGAKYIQKLTDIYPTEIPSDEIARFMTSVKIKEYASLPETTLACRSAQHGLVFIGIGESFDNDKGRPMPAYIFGDVEGYAHTLLVEKFVGVMERGYGKLERPETTFNLEYKTK